MQDTPENTASTASAPEPGVHPGAGIRARGVTVGYGDGPDIVHGVDLDVLPGSVTTLIGPNGCGKSTILKSLSKLLVPRSGTVEVAGAEVHALSAREAARRIALLPQHPVAPEGLTVGELVFRGRHPYRRRWWGRSEADREAVRAALAATGITALAGRDVALLSGGQRQRAWIAMALAQETPVLLLDEPTTYLDPAHAVEVLDLVQRLSRRRGIAVLMVLHDLNLAARFSDRIVVMRDGRMLAGGVPGEVLTPQLMREAYGLEAGVERDPLDGTPVVLPRRAAAGAVE